MIIAISNNNVSSRWNRHAFRVALLTQAIESRRKSGFQASILIEDLDTMIVLVWNNHVVVHVESNTRWILEHRLANLAYEVPITVKDFDSVIVAVGDKDVTISVHYRVIRMIKFFLGVPMATKHAQ